MIKRECLLKRKRVYLSNIASTRLQTLYKDSPEGIGSTLSTGSSRFRVGFNMVIFSLGISWISTPFLYKLLKFSKKNMLEYFVV